MKKLLSVLLWLFLFPALAMSEGRTQQVDFLLNGVRDNSGNPLAAGTVTTYSAGTTSNKTCWTAYDKSQTASNPFTLDAYGRATVFCDGDYKFLIKDSSGTTIQTLDNLHFGIEDPSFWDVGSAGGSANTLTGNAAPAFPTLVNGQEVGLLATATNTSATPTFALNGLAAKTIVRPDGTALLFGDIASGTHYKLKYNLSSDKWILLNPSLQIATTDGWTNAGESWTFNSATSITVPSDATTKYAVGDKIKLAQSGSTKYFYIIGVTSTTITVTGGSDYTVANAAITSPYYAHHASPVGFPQVFNWTPTVGGFTATVPTNTVYQFNIAGGICNVFVRQQTNGTSNATTFTISAPVAAKTVTNGVWNGPMTSWADNGASGTALGIFEITSGGSTINLYTSVAGAGWTSSNGKRCGVGMISYPIQ